MNQDVYDQYDELLSRTSLIVELATNQFSDELTKLSREQLEDMNQNHVKQEVLPIYLC